MTAYYSPGAPTRIIIKPKRLGKKVWWEWHVEQEGSWARDCDREKEDFVDPEPTWEQVKVDVFDWESIRTDFATRLMGLEKTQEKAELASRLELAKVVTYFNQKDRDEEWIEMNKIVVDA